MLAAQSNNKDQSFASPRYTATTYLLSSMHTLSEQRPSEYQILYELILFKGPTHITNSKEARTQRRQAILYENDFSLQKNLNGFFSKQRFSTPC